MEELVRFGVTMPQGLLERFDRSTDGFRNRSDALRRLVTAWLAEREWAPETEVVGSLTLLYDHRRAETSGELTDLGHRFGRLIHSSLHVHLDHNRCLETIVVQGRAVEVRELSDRLSAVRGVIHCRLTAVPAQSCDEA